MDTLGRNGRIFNIQQFSVHDGPGIRTIVFLKGCPLRCRWCCNPESQSPQPELAYDARKCIGTGECGLCIQRCDRNAMSGGEGGRLRLDRGLCTNCGVCGQVCPSKAIEMIGREMSVREVLGSVEGDFCFYSRSGGGLTLSGGEPLFQPDFAIELLKGAKAIGMDTAIETCGHVEWEVLDEAAAHTNTIIYDVKCIDSRKHREFTGISNDRILENFEKLCGKFPNIPKTVRTPVVPEFNDTREEIRAIAQFLEPFPNVKHELLAYHAFGESKYTFMGKPYRMSGAKPPDKDRMTYLRGFAQ